MTEFKVLFGPELADAEAQLPPEQHVAWPTDSLVIYAFAEGKIIGRMGVMAIKVIEGSYASPGYPTLGFRLMKQMEKLLKYLGSSHAIALVYDEMPAVADYLQRVEFKKEPLTVYSKEL